MLGKGKLKLIRPKVDYKKVNRTRRSRGYGFEHTNVIGALQKAGWWAKRLGGSSSGLPDIVATKDDTMYSIEAKSAMMPKKTYCYVPMDQIQRCISVLEGFKLYKHRFLVFAFKFSLKGSSKPTYHFFQFDMDDEFMKDQFDWTYSQVRCDRYGGLGLKSIDSAMKLMVEVQYTQKTDKLPFDLYTRHVLSTT